MSAKTLRTSDLARAVGVHPNTVRLYVDWGLIPSVERNQSSYRLFTQKHLDCLRLARMIYSSEYPGRDLRASSNEIIQHAVADDWLGALEKAQEHLAAVKTELKSANQAADLLEHWAHTCPGGRCQGNMAAESDGEPLATGEVSKLLGVSMDVLRNWERNGLISVRRNSYNNYRLFGKREIERLRVIRMLSHAGYSHMAMLRMFIELDGGKTRGLKKVLDTPRADEDIYTAADHWLTTLQGQEKLAKNVIKLIEKIIKARD